MRTPRRLPPAPRTAAKGRRARPRQTAGAAFERLVDIMAVLRGPGGCAWDQRQTHATLRGYLIEECYEAVEAIDANRLDDLPGELGDVLLQCVFHAQLGAERHDFDIVSVVQAISEKLVRRHPHIFAADGRRLTARQRAQHAMHTPEAVKQQWAQLKALEQTTAGRSPEAMAGVPKSLPALLRAQKLGARAAAIGFDWPSAADVIAKIQEEVDELRDALSDSPARAADEMGDVLFSLANLARKLGVEPEAALAAANDKFTRRFTAMESAFRRRRLDIHQATPAQLEAEWQRVKKARRRSASTSSPSTSPSSRASRRIQSEPRRRGRS
jgi:MazG family protein